MDKLMAFEGQQVMILLKEDVDFKFKGDFLVRAKDASGILEYAQANDFVNIINPKYVYKVKNSDLAKSQNRKLNNAGEIFISNFGLNQGVANSTMPKAEPFQDWLYEEMLPSVQKHGAYLTPDAIEKTLADPDFIIRVATELKNERSKRVEAENKLLEVAPKIAYIDNILKSKSTVTTSQISKDYGLTAAELNKILKEEKVQYKVNDQWLLRVEHDNKGYTQSYTIDIVRTDGRQDVKMNTRWTQTGRLFIHEILTKRGFKANIEKEYNDAR
jgi:anti-repressor protein